MCLRVPTWQPVLAAGFADHSVDELDTGQALLTQLDKGWLAANDTAVATLLEAGPIHSLPVQQLGGLAGVGAEGAGSGQFEEGHSHQGGADSGSTGTLDAVRRRLGAGSTPVSAAGAHTDAAGVGGVGSGERALLADPTGKGGSGGKRGIGSKGGGSVGGGKADAHRPSSTSNIGSEQYLRVVWAKIVVLRDVLKVDVRGLSRREETIIYHLSLSLSSSFIKDGHLAAQYWGHVACTRRLVPGQFVPTDPANTWPTRPLFSVPVLAPASVPSAPLGPQ